MAYNSESDVIRDWPEATEQALELAAQNADHLLRGEPVEVYESEFWNLVAASIDGAMEELGIDY